ncbi:hypothetical protein LIER_44165 [Lithospermum erythrorhizon]|uniref:Uncharacterized protein n=1 Tax=Lithospermum erythrorhizon TaxID=34254 RepID=A0AAV3RBK2_LITER
MAFYVECPLAPGVQQQLLPVYRYLSRSQVENDLQAFGSINFTVQVAFMVARVTCLALVRRLPAQGKVTID